MALQGSAVRARLAPLKYQYIPQSDIDDLGQIKATIDRELSQISIYR
jgi:hypothetical protein